MSKTNRKVAGVPGGWYTKPGSDIIYYRVKIRGEIFRCSSGATKENEAESKKLALYQAAVKEVERREKAGNVRVTVGNFGELLDAYWDRVGKFHQSNTEFEDVAKMTDGARNTFNALAWLREAVKVERKLIEVDGNLVGGLVAKRRGEFAVRGKTVTDKLVSPATVNRSVTQVMRKLMLFAKEDCRAETSPIKWSKYELDEPQERVRELGDGEEAALFGEDVMHDDMADLVDFSILSGFRKCESAFRLEWEHCDWGNRRLQVHGKGGKLAYVPMTEAMREILWRQWSKENRHDRLVFSRLAKKDSRYGDKRGERYAWTRTALNSAWRRARAAAGLKDYRWHDHRHTAATRVLRNDPRANLKTVQILLRHSDLATTSKYAHVRDEDLMAAMEAGAAASVRRKTAQGDPALVSPAGEGVTCGVTLAKIGEKS